MEIAAGDTPGRFAELQDRPGQPPQKQDADSEQEEKRQERQEGPVFPDLVHAGKTILLGTFHDYRPPDGRDRSVIEMDPVESVMVDELTPFPAPDLLDRFFVQGNLPVRDAVQQGCLRHVILVRMDDISQILVHDRNDRVLVGTDCIDHLRQLAEIHIRGEDPEKPVFPDDGDAVIGDQVPAGPDIWF